MEKFKSMYLFTTENIAGYMNKLDLTNKKIVTVTGSADHILNVILKGCNEITTFDINPYSKYYMELKIAAIKQLKYNDFLDFILFDTPKTFSYEIITSLKIDEKCKKFWIKELVKNKNDGLKLKYSDLFNTNYFDPKAKKDYNLYFNQHNYDIIKTRLDNVNIIYLETNLKNLKLEDKYDYMFLSNISDYLDLMFENNCLENYNKLINNFLKNVHYIYFAYVYDVNKNTKRSAIDDIENVKKIFGNIKIETLSSALINKTNLLDAVFIKESI